MNATKTVEFVRKPVLNVMALLSLLGNTSTTAITGVEDSRTGSIGVVPSLRINSGAAGAVSPAEATVVAYFSKDSSDKQGQTAVTLMLEGLPAALAGDVNAMVCGWFLNNTHGSAQYAWQRQGSPHLPSASQLSELREAMEIPMLPLFPRPLSASHNGTAVLHGLPLSLPGVVALHACARPVTAPRAVSNLRVHVTTTKSPPEVVVYWSEPTDARCILTYVVSFAATAQGPFHRVNEANTIFTAYIHAQPLASKATGCYQVTVVDYWQRSSSPTAPVCL